MCLTKHRFSPCHLHLIPFLDDATSTLDGGHFRLLGFETLHPPRALRPDEEKEALPAHTVFSGKRAEDELGIVYKSLAEMVSDIVEDFGGRGWLKHLEN